MKLTHEFYNRHVVEVAKDLLGKELVVGDFRGIITETEAYRGSDDEASHAARGITERSKIMFGPAGYVYIYIIYGMYYCLNIVTEEAGQASAVLIRGIRLPDVNLNGPGKVCRHLNITKTDNGINLAESDYIYLTDGERVSNFTTTPRIGHK